MQPQYSISKLANTFTPAFTSNLHPTTSLSMTNSIISDISFFYSNQTLSNPLYNTTPKLYCDLNRNTYFNSNDHLVYYKSSFNNFLMDLNTTSTYSKTSTLFYNFTTKNSQPVLTKLTFKY